MTVCHNRCFWALQHGQEGQARLGNAVCDSGKLYGRKLEVGSDTVEILLIRIKV